MIGQLRLRNIRTLLETIIRDGIPGDIIEAGVWRGGACIYTRAILEAHRIKDRVLSLLQTRLRDCRHLTPASIQLIPVTFTISLMSCQVSLEQVQANFSKYGLLDDQVIFSRAGSRTPYLLRQLER